MPLDLGLGAAATAHARTTGGRLLGVLCNPSVKETSRTISWKNLTVLSDVLGLPDAAITNLIDVPTGSTRALAHLAGAIDPELLEERVATAAGFAGRIVVAWGTTNPPGWSRQQWRELTAAAARGIGRGGHQTVAVVGGAARHPSRWRQHTSPVHDRYRGSTFDARLMDALTWVDLESLAK